MVKQYRLTRRYEKPFLTRRRINFEKAKAIYNEDMSRKIKFVMRVNREALLDPAEDKLRESQGHLQR